MVMNMKRLTTGFLMIALIFSMTSCRIIPTIRDEEETTAEINPLPEAANRIDQEVTLYFRYAEQDMLAGETRSIEVPVNENIEMTVLKELLNGPSQNNQELIALIPEDTEIISISDSGEYLFVTLSSEFISKSKIANSVEENEETYQQAREEMNLSIYSMVNTLIELGGFSRVQILVDQNDSGRGERITLSELGVGEVESASLEPLGWNSDVILTPENTMSLMLELMGQRDFENLYALIAYNDSKDINHPSKDEFIDLLSSLESSIEEYAVLDGKVSADGTSVIVPINFTIKTRNGDIVANENIIMRLRQERDLWKVEYSSFNKVFLES